VEGGILRSKPGKKITLHSADCAVFFFTSQHVPPRLIPASPSQGKSKGTPCLEEARHWIRVRIQPTPRVVPVQPAAPLLRPRRALNVVAAPSPPLLPTGAPSPPRRSAASHSRRAVHKVAPRQLLRLPSSTSLSALPPISLPVSSLPKVSRGIGSPRSYLRFAPLPGRRRAWSRRVGFSLTRAPPSISITVSS
jgi:hypothetical protein